MKFGKFPACAVAATLIFATSAIAQSSPDDVESLRQQVKDLQSQLQSVQAQLRGDWVSEQRAEEIRQIVQDVLADSDTRSSLLDAGLTAGYDGGAVIASSDGNYKIKINFQEQVRFVANFQDSDASTDASRWGFENRRTKLILDGNVVDPTWTYEVQLNADRASGVVSMEDAGWIGKDLGDGWKLRVGQMKAPFLREEIMSSRRLFTIERSLINDEFSAKIVQGLWLNYSAERWKIFGMYHDGSVNGVNSGSGGTAWSQEDTEYAFSARFEWLAAGNWKQTEDYSGFRGDETTILIGTAINWQKQEYGTGNNLLFPDYNNNEIENFGFTIDASIEGSGWNVNGAFVYRSLDPASGSSLDQYGFVIRGGYFITDDIELYASYEWADADIDGVDDLSVITIGGTKYFAKHNLKWQSDIGFGLNEVNAIWAADGAGWRADGPDADTQVVIRSQLQLLF
ncbi:MAG TPA: porin [Phycisphaerales bacterium]|nr:porin [Phycisphaerales bacterium]